MNKIDRMRERVSILPTSVYLSKMHDAGWSLVALEWEREVETSAEPEEREAPVASEEIPFGLRIASDCRHLEDDPLETSSEGKSHSNTARKLPGAARAHDLGTTFSTGRQAKLRTAEDSSSNTSKTV